MAKIGEKTLDDEEETPVLQVEEWLVDENGSGVVAVELSFKADDWKIVDAQMVQVISANSDEGSQSGVSAALGGSVVLPGRRVRHTIAKVRMRDSRAKLFQVCYHNLQHYAPSGKTGRHAFTPE